MKKNYSSLEDQMNSKTLLAKFKSHKTSRREIQDMLEMIKRDLEGISGSRIE